MFGYIQGISEEIWQSYWFWIIWGLLLIIGVVYEYRSRCK